MSNIKNNNQSTTRPSHFSVNYAENSSDGLLNNRNLSITNPRNNFQISSSSTHSNDTNSGSRNHDSQRITRFVRLINKTLPRSNSSLRANNTRSNVICQNEQSSNSVEPYREQRRNEISQQSSIPDVALVTNKTPTTHTSNEEEEEEEEEDDDDDGYTDVGDSSSSDDDAPFESMYNRRIPIPSTLFSNAHRTTNSRSSVKHNTRRCSLRRQSRYITTEWLNRSQLSSTTYSSAYANLLPLSLSHSFSLTLPPSTKDNSHEHSQQSPYSEQVPAKSNADSHEDDNQMEDCLLCIEPLELRGGRMILNPGCGHLMHMKCYMEYINNFKDSCAICAKKFPSWDH